MRNLLDRPDDDSEVLECVPLREDDPLVAPVLAAQEPDGAWTRGDLHWQGGKQRVTMLALMRLGFLGFGPEHQQFKKAQSICFHCNDDGGWGTPGRFRKLIRVRVIRWFRCRRLSHCELWRMCGYAEDPRAEHAYAWLLDKRLPDGAWPTGIAGGGTYGYVAGYRKMPHSRWGCRSNTTGVLQCLAYHPETRQSTEARGALDMLLGRETREAHTLGYEVTRLIGAEPTRGFFTFYARFDLAQVLDLCWRIGATRDDARVDEIVTFVQSLQGEYGLWDVTGHPEASRWVTYDFYTRLRAWIPVGIG